MQTGTLQTGTRRRRRNGWLRGGVAIAILTMVILPGNAQPRAPQSKTASQAGGGTAAHRTRLFLKDGSYQVVMSYRVVGSRVIFISAERGGAEEEIPVALIDFNATHRWEQQHPAPGSEGDPAQAPAPTIDPELLKEEESRRALTPEVATDLRLPEQDSVVALDTFRGTPELVPLSQSESDLNRTTSHNILRGVINPMSASHQIVQLKGEKAAVQLHINQPELYVRTGEDSGIRTGGTPLTVDTHGASAAQTAAKREGKDSRYVIVRVDVRQNARVLASFNINKLGDVRQQQDVVETVSEPLPGGHWLKLTTKAPLSFGEYALMEVISPREVNLGVWDFGVHPTEPENRDVLKPEPKKPVTLERRTTGLVPH